MRVCERGQACSWLVMEREWGPINSINLSGSWRMSDRSLQVSVGVVAGVAVRVGLGGWAGRLRTDAVQLVPGLEMKMKPGVDDWDVVVWG